MSRSNFTPMERFKEILSTHGLRMMEVGVNHLRVFKDEKKVFDYYPLRMKLFDYHEWKQLTFPLPGNGKTAWEDELKNFIKKTTDGAGTAETIPYGMN